MAANEQTVGRNGVVITRRAPHDGRSAQYRTYEVYQRERVGESTEKIRPAQLASDQYRQDPYPLVGILRDNYPCYRDWMTNSFWISRYNDVTSVFTDDANFETRSRSWLYGIEGYGRNLADELPAIQAEAALTDSLSEGIAAQIIEDLAKGQHTDLASQFAMRFSFELLAAIWHIPDQDRSRFCQWVWRMQRGLSLQSALQEDAVTAVSEIERYLEPLLRQRRESPQEDYLSVLATLELEDGPTTAADLATTLLERDFETLHGGLANLWYLLLTHPEEFEKARSERRLMKLAYLEMLRHSTPVITAHRFACHEVERFGRLIPGGARLTLSAAAANRDPSIFDDPDRFVVDRRDMSQREPRGQYRADGLATGIAFALGKPSIHPALPEDRPRSRYAISRDVVVTVSEMLQVQFPDLQLVRDAAPRLESRTLGEMHTCWHLPATLK